MFIDDLKQISEESILGQDDTNVEEYQNEQSQQNEQSEHINQLQTDDISQSNNEIFIALAKDLTQRGFKYEEDFDGDEDKFFLNLEKQAIDKAKSSLNLNNEKTKRFIDYLEHGGNADSLIQDYLDYDKILTLSDEDLFKLYYKNNSKFKDEEINRLAEKTKLLEKFDEEVNTIRGEIQEEKDNYIAQQLENLKHQKKQEEEAKKIQLETYNNVLKQDTISGIPITDKANFISYITNATEPYEHNGKKIMITKHQKSQIDRQSDIKAQTEHEILLAYLEYIQFKPYNNQKEKIIKTTSNVGNLKPKSSLSYLTQINI